MGISDLLIILLYQKIGTYATFQEGKLSQLMFCMKIINCIIR